MVMVAVPLVRPVAAAWMVAVPSRLPVRALVATPEAAVAEPVPDTVPVPVVLVKVMELLALVTVLP